MSYVDIWDFIIRTIDSNASTFIAPLTSADLIPVLGTRRLAILAELAG